MDYLRSDCILKEILEDRKTLTGFLDAVFGFMSRNTDFYYIQKTKEDKLGFPRGVKEKIIMSCMQKYEHALTPPKLTSDFVSEEPQTFVAEEIEIVSEAHNKWNKNQQGPIDVLEISKHSASSTNTIKFNESDYKNGSVFENYCWSQTLKDVELIVLLPKMVKSSKHIKACFKSNYIAIKTLLLKEEILLNGETWDKYRHNDVIWSISGERLIINFDKLMACWWDKLFLNETAIDIKTVDTERSINEYSPDIQNVVEKIRTQKNFPDQVRKMPLNKNEQKDCLRKAWDADGSPFKGQTFDPSAIQFI